MALIHANVFDAALTHIKSNADNMEVRNASSAVLVGPVALNSGNYTGPAAYSSGSDSGRKLTALTSSASDMKNLSVASGGGTATKVVLKDASPATDLVVASISGSTVALGTTDKVNLSTFDVILKDPT